MDMHCQKTTLLSYLSLAFSLILILSNLIFAPRLIITKYFTLPGGLIFYPFTFLLSDIVNEIYGSKKAKQIVYSAFVGNAASVLLVQIFSILPTTRPEIHEAWKLVFDLNPFCLFFSFTAFLASQYLDIFSFSLLKKTYPNGSLWMRSNISTCLSQIIDTLIVDLGIVYIGMGLSLTKTFYIMTCSYSYKVFFSLITSPILCFLVKKINHFIDFTKQTED
ncbi:putative integral membrane family protein [Chlamydia ibidis]|uniref:Probable queuosine precursor transporter n=2 Tax=Chlamydia ibidis TaxID=1405396 RepID=S7J3B5_9CHLA|nr:queuosine precursor transporter [Chlamydia ibidis]EPP34904.1 putative integral membrane family protein [Chlamydia ibidis]EQM62317.1 conserved hypothetical integral membrane family protein [Chlamydia ibidis 10-1398/6]